MGIDEVGRGPWAGPLVVGAVVLGGASIEGLTDSKKLTKLKRASLDITIREQAAGYGLGWVSSAEIDEIGLAAALRLATIRAVEQVTATYHEIIIDGTINFLKETTKGRFVTTLPKADLLVPSVSAASIIAKVARDTYMAAQDQHYPGYGFTNHVGYGTQAHRSAIAELGVTPLHRLSFAPLSSYRLPNVADALDEQIENKKIVKQPTVRRDPAARPTTKQIGDAAESVAAEYLVQHGHDILERNWKTKFCEIDIISLKNRKLYFSEVKYRHSAKHGDGLAAITPKKQQQMKFAADYYVVSQSLKDVAMVLTAIAVTETPPLVTHYLEII